jgi:hypothetical protein
VSGGEQRGGGPGDRAEEDTAGAHAAIAVEAVGEGEPGESAADGGARGEGAHHRRDGEIAIELIRGEIRAASGDDVCGGEGNGIMRDGDGEAWAVDEGAEYGLVADERR